MDNAQSKNKTKQNKTKNNKKQTQNKNKQTNKDKNKTKTKKQKTKTKQKKTPFLYFSGYDYGILKIKTLILTSLMPRIISKWATQQFFFLSYHRFRLCQITILEITENWVRLLIVHYC